MVTGNRGRESDETETVYQMTSRELMSHIKQMINSLAQTGFVHEIEDRENPFNGIKVHEIHVIREEDFDEDGEDDDDDD